MENTRGFANTPVMWHHKTGILKKKPKTKTKTKQKTKTKKKKKKKGIFRQIPGDFPVPQFYNAATARESYSVSRSWSIFSSSLQHISSISIWIIHSFEWAVWFEYA